MALVSIGKADLGSGQNRCINAKGKKLALVNIDGKYYCVDNTCTHAGGPLCEGEMDKKEGFGLVCPWHGSTFDLRTGKAIKGPATDPVKAYKITEKNGELFVEV